MAIENFDEVKTYLTENLESEDVSGFVGELVKNSVNDDFLEKLNTEHEGFQKWFTSRTDQRVSKSIETWKEKHLDAILQERENKVREELLPNETPEQKMLKTMKKEQDELKRQNQFEKMENYAIKYANSLDLKLGDDIKLFVKDNEQEIKKALDLFHAYGQNQRETGKNEYLKNTSRVPESGDDERPNVRFKSWDQYRQYLKNGGKYDEQEYKELAGRLGGK